MELLIIGMLIALGIILLAAEVLLIPGIGITGVLGGSAMLGSVVYAFTNISVFAGWLTLLINTVLIVALILWAVHSKTLSKMALKKNIESTTANADASTVKVGDCGYAVTRLALIGEARFGDSIVEVTSSDGFIDEKADVIVERISANVIYVKHK